MENDPRIDVLVDRTDRILHLLDGRDGLVERVTALEVSVDDLKEDLDNRAPSKKEKRGLWVGAGTGMAAFVGYLLTDLLPKLKG